MLLIGLLLVTLTSVTWLRPEPYKFKWPNFFWKLIVSFVIYRRQTLSSVSMTSLCWLAEEWWRGRWEGGSGWGTHVNPWLIHVNVWQKPLQYYKVISLQLIKINEKKKEYEGEKGFDLFWKEQPVNATLCQPWVFGDGGSLSPTALGQGSHTACIFCGRTGTSEMGLRANILGSAVTT